MSRVLVAGVGNVFFGDDGFGCAVIKRVSERVRGAGVNVRDFGIAGLHLAYELSSGYDRAIIVDAVARGGRAGTLYLLDPERDAAQAVVAGHDLDLASVIALARRLGKAPPRLVVVGCEAMELCERIGLSETLARAVDPAVALIQTLLDDGHSAVAGGAQ